MEAQAVTTQQVRATLATVKAVGDTIRELGEVPSGYLYATVMNHMSLDDYQAVIRLLKKTDLVTESNNLLRWIGPKETT